MIASQTAVPLLVPDLPDRHALLPYLQRMDEARIYSNFGPLVCELEHRLAARFSAQAGGNDVFVTTVCNATIGLELALAALCLKPGSKVLVPALTFVATATSVIRAGHVPVIADIDVESWLLTPTIADAAYEVEAFDAVMTVASFGMPHDSQAWNEFSASRGVPVIIDAAGAFGNQWLEHGRHVRPEQVGEGGSGGVEVHPRHRSHVSIVYSMHTTKSLPAGEGGLVVCSDADFIHEIRQQSNFGLHAGSSRGHAVAVTNMLGTNAKMSEYHATVGLASLDRWAERAVIRRALMGRYRAALSQASGGELVWQRGGPLVAPTLLCVRWPGAAKADTLERLGAAHGVMTRRWYQPLLHEHPMADACATHLATPVAEQLAPELIGLPFFAQMSEAQISSVVSCIELAAESCSASSASMSATSAISG